MTISNHKNWIFNKGISINYFLLSSLSPQPLSNMVSTSDPDAGFNISANCWHDQTLPNYRVPDHSGWMKQLITATNKNKTILANFRWSERWCVLHNSSLYTYKNDVSGFASSYLYLPHCQISVIPEQEAKFTFFKKYVIVISDDEAKVHLAFKDIHQRRRWLTRLNEAQLQKKIPDLLQTPRVKRRNDSKSKMLKHKDSKLVRCRSDQFSKFRTKSTEILNF